MRHTKNLWAITAAVAVGIIIAWSFTSIQGSQKMYEVQPQITLPRYSNDTAHLLEAYERLMDRYMDLVEKNLTTLDLDIKGTSTKIDTIDLKLTELSERIARIEKALGIVSPEESAQNILRGEQDGSLQSTSLKGRR